MMRRIVIGLVLALTFVADTQAKQRLNVVLILVDDMGWMDLGCQGSKFYETPHIDRLAKQGMRFDNAYAACAVCSPTRAAVMTGRYPSRLGVTDWIRARFQRRGRRTPASNPTKYVGGPRRKLLCPPNPFWMEHREITIAEVLRNNGYKTCHIGKWHLGDDAWFPQHQGFHLNFGGCDYGQPPGYFDPFVNRRLKQGIPHLPGRKKGQYLTDREGEEAEKFIRENKDQPFFLYYAPYAVHTPIQAKRKVTEKYQAKKKLGLKRPAYAAMVESVDDAVGRILKTLADLKLAERTLVIFTSDNGGLDRNGSPTENAPLRSGKGYPYEGGIRVPLIVRWPGVVKPNQVSHLPVSSIDYFPTIQSAVGAEEAKAAKIDGMSLVPHLRSNGSKKLNRDSLLWHFPHYRHRPGPYSIVRQSNWKMIKYYEGPKYELYNLAKDLGESKDLAAAMPDQVKKLNQRLDQLLATTKAKLPRVNPNYRPARRNKRNRRSEKGK